MKRTLIMSGCLSALTSLALAQATFGDDFTITTGTATFPPSSDSIAYWAPAGQGGPIEGKFTGVSDANNRRLDNGLGSGTWGGYAAAGADPDGLGFSGEVLIVEFAPPQSSNYGNPQAENGFLQFEALAPSVYSNENTRDETGSYVYTILPFGMDLSGPNARVSFDLKDASGNNTSSSFQLLMRSGAGTWMVSNVVGPINYGIDFAQAAAADITVSSLTFNEIDPATAAVLDNLDNSDLPVALVTGAATPAGTVTARLASIDGFGIVLADNLLPDTTPPTAFPTPGVAVDALLIEEDAATSVRDWTVY